MKIERFKKQNLILEGLQRVKIDEGRVDKELAKLVTIKVDDSRVMQYRNNPKMSKKIENSMAYAKEQFLKDLNGHALEYPVEFIPDKVLDVMRPGDKFKVYVTISKYESPENEKMLLNSDFYVSRGNVLVKQYQKERKSRKDYSSYSSYYD